MNRNLQDQSVYTDDELRKDKAVLQREIEALEQEMDELEAEYRTFIEKGVEASESEMRQFARRADVAEKKIKIKSSLCDEKRRELAAVQLAKTVRELQSRAGRETTWVPDLVDEIPDAVIEETEIDLNEFAFEWGLEMKMLEEADETLNTGLLQVIDVGGETNSGVSWWSKPPHPEDCENDHDVPDLSLDEDILDSDATEVMNELEAGEMDTAPSLDEQVSEEDEFDESDGIGPESDANLSG